jgi:hypothetical protein
LQPLNVREREQLMQLLGKLVHSHEAKNSD